MGRRLVVFDWVIKRLLRSSKANFGVLEGFLSELLHTDITIIEVLDGESNKESSESKSNRVDIKVNDTDKNILLIEIQCYRELDYLQRIIFGTSKTITEHIAESKAYSNVVKVISVNILYFKFEALDDYVYHGTTIFHGIHSHSILELNDAQKKLFGHQKVADIHPEYYLINVNNFNDNVKDAFDEWIYFLKNVQIKDSFMAKGIKEAVTTLDILKMDEKERAAYERYCDQLRYEASMYESTYVAGREEGREERRVIGKEEGMVIGKEEGMEIKEIELVKSMAENGINIENICKITKLTLEKIEHILGKKRFNTAEIMMRNGESDEKIVLYSGLSLEKVRGLRKKL